MAVDRGTSQEEINSFASLLKTFLPDHSDLPLTGSTEELIQHINESSSIDSKCVMVCAQAKGPHLGQGGGGQKDIVRNEQCKTYGSLHQAASSQCSAVKQSTDSSQLNIAEQISCSNSLLEHQARKNTANAELHTCHDLDIAEPSACSSSSSSNIIPDLGNSLTSDADHHGSLLLSKDSLENKSLPAFPSQKRWLHKVKHFACFVCDETFLELSPYAVHMKAHCQKAINIKCSDCGETLSSKASFIAHRKLSTYEIRVDRAQISLAENLDPGESSDGGTPVTKQKKKDDGDECYFCSMCMKKTYKYSTYLKHVRTHKDVMLFSCAVCHESFHAACLLRYHIDLQHSHVMPFQCRRCLRRFKLKCSLSTHLRYCDVDPSSLPFAEEMQFIDQLSQQRKYQVPGEEENDDLCQYSCPICTLMFDSPDDLKSHMNHHDETKPYKCDQCGRGFRSRYVLRKHASVHTTKHECRCEICGVQLLTLSGYNAHLRGHRNQEKIQAKFFPESSNETNTNNESLDTAHKILQRIKNQKERKSEIEEVLPPTNSETITTPCKKNKTYKCPICGLLFFSGGVNFQIHARREHKDAEFEKCTFCNKTFLGKENLDRHIRLHKMFADSYSCDECGKTFRRKFALQVHKNMHGFKKFVKCDICGQEFRFVSEVEKHKNKKHRYDRLINIYKCSICGQRFPMLSHLSVHCHCHNLPDSTPFECDLCKKSYKTSLELKRHIFEKHDKLLMMFGDSAFIQDLGSFGLSSTQPVDGGGDATASKMKLTDVETTASGAVFNVNELASRLHSKFQALEQLNDNKHASEYSLVKEHEESNTSNSEDRVVSSATTSLPSNVDAYNLATRQFYHQTKFLKRYVCEVCQKAFSSNSDLKTHRRTHSGETPFKCEFCDRSFKQRGHRKLHTQVVHTKEMPYKCDQCDSAFPTRYRYQIHIKRHSGLREHQCAYCERGYYTLGKLNEHKKKRHAEEWQLEQKQKDE